MHPVRLPSRIASGLEKHMLSREVSRPVPYTNYERYIASLTFDDATAAQGYITQFAHNSPRAVSASSWLCSIVYLIVHLVVYLFVYLVVYLSESRTASGLEEHMLSR